ncbi:MAG: hypothetical protein EOO44_22055 [Flavobacterium sp.]|nr:MAG: hypothetical protein EOO44_22055 [Flavobacterium sp.]
MSEKKKIYLSLSIVLSMGIVLGIGKQGITLLYFQDSISHNFLRAYGFIDLFFGFISPFMLYTFLCITSFLMAAILGEKITLKSIYANIGIGFFPLLVIATITSVIVYQLDKNDLDNIVNSSSGNYNLRWGISFLELRYFNYLGYICLYAYIFLFFKKKEHFEIINSSLITFLPTLVTSMFFVF